MADHAVFTPYWSEPVLEAVKRNVVRIDHSTEAAMDHRLDAMRTAFPLATVNGFEPLIPSMTNHPGDRHVLAACVVSPAHAILTFNTKDFPPESLAAFDIDVIHPDVFLLDQLDLHPLTVGAALHSMLKRNKWPPRDFTALAQFMERAQVPRFAAAIRNLNRLD